MGNPFPGAWSFENFPFLREIHNCKSELIVSMKAAQLGLTETALNKCFYTLDILGRDVLYLLPNKNPDAADFSNSRFGPALDMSPHLKSLFIETDNQGHKRAGNANLYVRGSKSKAGLRSIPVSLIILDEVDVMTQENIPLALERASGQLVKQAFMLSTPTVADTGIDFYFKTTTQENFQFPCPSCSKFIHLELKNLKMTSDDPNSAELKNTHLICTECQATLPHQDKSRMFAKGIWVPTKTSEARGFSINQLYSPALRPYELAASYLRGQTNPFDAQEFYNSKLGLPHTVDGARITDENINARTGTFKQLMPEDLGNGSRFITIGADIGKFIHTVICDWYIPKGCNSAIEAVPRVIAMRELLHFEELDLLIQQYRPNYVVVDKNPERRKATEFASRFPGRVSCCEYSQGIRAREIIDNESENTIQVDRTSWLDLTLGRCQRPNGIIFPTDMMFRFREHLKAQTRVYLRDKDGNPNAKWVKGSQDDHFSHALNYSEIAFSKALRFGVGNRNISSPW